MLSLTELKKGTLIDLDGKPHLIIDYQHTQLGRGGAVVRAKVKNLVDGSVRQETFKGSDRVNTARVDKIDMQFLYRQGNQVVLMDTSDYSQLTVPAEDVAEQLPYLNEGANVIALKYGQRIIGIELPFKVVLKVAKADPGVRGDTSKAALKTVELETGAKVQVPLFINQGESIRIDTRSGQYIERA
jgi:elongation factor P